MVSQKKLGIRIGLKNKRGWIRIAEAAMAILLLASTILILITRQAEQNSISEDMYNLQQLILDEAAKNLSVRNAVLNSATSSDLNLVQDFVSERMPLGIDFNISVCNPAGPCNVETPVMNEEIYVADMLISSTLQQYGNPLTGQSKKLKIVSWISSGGTARRGYGPTNTVIVYLFDEGIGSGSMIVHDSSGNSFNGEIICEPTCASWVAGIYGSALKFDGNNFVNITTLPEITRALTIEAWIKPDSITPEDGIIMKPYYSNQDNLPNMIYGITISPTNSVRFSVAINGIRYDVDSPNAIPLDWTFVTGMYDTSSSKLRLYINGQWVADTPTAGGPLDTNNLPVWIGKGKVVGMAGMFKGTIDNLKVYSKALSATEVANHYGPS